jgi:hypothetical protein
MLMHHGLTFSFFNLCLFLPLPFHVPFQALCALGSAPLLYYHCNHFSCAALWARGSTQWFGETRQHDTLRSHRVLRIPAHWVSAFAVGMSGGVRKFSEKEILDAFGSAEEVPFPMAALEELLPEVCGHCKLVADTLSVPLSWVLLTEVCAAAFLAPTSVLMPTKTMPLYAMPWAFILHSGATQTSGLMSTYSRTFRQLELWETDFQVRLAKEQPRQNEQVQEGQDAGEPLQKCARSTAPAAMHMGFTSGSLDGIVGRMAEPQNI